MGKPAATPVIIAHRGASAYLPEHTLASKALAYGMGADFLEQDLVLSRDGVPVVFHDLVLDALTDVRSRFPGRARPDGQHYVLDFDFSELRQLAVHERCEPATGRPRYPGRFPPAAGTFRIASFEQEVRFIQGLNRAAGRTVGIYPEIKHPVWHRDQGQDLTAAALDVLGQYGYLDGHQPVYLQCFDEAELRAIHARVGAALPLILLAGGHSDVAGRLDDVSTFAAGIGPSLRLFHLDAGAGGRAAAGGSLVADAHARGLVVHPYTLRADDLPAGVPDLETLLRICVDDLGVDGVFTDFPDRVRRYLAGA
jgi:glycerophosphoryl diester phosphodiesterase